MASAFLLAVDLGQPVDYLRHGYKEALSQNHVGNVSKLLAEEQVDPAQPKVEATLDSLTRSNSERR
jgi:hypothetical protein